MNEMIYQSNTPAPFRVDIYSWQKGVTGSMTFLAITFSDGRKSYGIVDAGIVQGVEEDKVLLHFDPKILDFIIITHPHADHVAKLALLYNKGCRAKIYTSHMTDTLLQLALIDAEKIMLSNCKLLNQKPWYSTEDTKRVIENICGKTYFNFFPVHDGVECLLVDNGHMMGACSVFLKYTDRNKKTIVHFFTGDYKPHNKLKRIRGVSYAFEVYPELKKAPTSIISEATYGEDGRAEKRINDEKENKYIKEVLSGIADGKTVFIPTLSLERPAPELYELKLAQDKRLLSVGVPIYVSGNLLCQYIRIMLASKYADVDFMPKNVKIIENITYKSSDGFHLKDALLPLPNDPKIVIASSGMCQYGVSVTLLQEYLPSSNAKILFTCYLAEGTLGREILKAKTDERIWVQGCLTRIRAEIAETSQFSGHASPDELISLFKEFDNVKFIALHHGEKNARRDFGKRLDAEFSKAKILSLGEEHFFRTSSWGLVTSKPLPLMFE